MRWQPRRRAMRTDSVRTNKTPPRAVARGQRSPLARLPRRVCNQLLISASPGGEGRGVAAALPCVPGVPGEAGRESRGGAAAVPAPQRQRGGVGQCRGAGWFPVEKSVLVVVVVQKCLVLGVGLLLFVFFGFVHYVCFVAFTFCCSFLTHPQGLHSPSCTRNRNTANA